MQHRAQRDRFNQGPICDNEARPPLSLLVWIEFAIVVLLLGGSFFFAMAETALISADRIEIRSRSRNGEVRAIALEKLLKHPEKLVTTVLVGNNIVNIVAATLATTIAIQLWATKGPIIAAVGMTFIVLVFGEITPKTLAVQRSLPLALLVARPVAAFQRALMPVNAVLSGISSLLLRLFGVRRADRRSFITQKQIQMLVQEGMDEGELEQFEHRVIQEVFDFTDTPLAKVMTPREKVRFLDKTNTMNEALEMVGRTGHSRLPVVDGYFDHVMGFVHAKDLLRYSDKELHELPVTQVIRAVLSSRGEARSDHVLARMQRERKLMAIVQNADGRNIGIATVEDLLEELVGEIHDEFDRPESPAPTKA